MNSYDVLIRPILSEKTHLAIAKKCYTFVVDFRADKGNIKKAVEEIFNVKVANVRTINVRGKLKRVRRAEGYTSKFKKAVIQLSEDSKALEDFESLS